MDNEIPIIVLNLTKKGNIEKALTGKEVGTMVVKE
jgi:uridylate kinase